MKKRISFEKYYYIFIIYDDDKMSANSTIENQCCYGIIVPKLAWLVGKQ